MTIVMHNKIFKSISEWIQKSLTNLSSDIEMSSSEVYRLLTPPPKEDMGHLAFACFPLAKALKKGPPLIAKELADVLGEHDLVEKIVPMGPYLNFFLNISRVGPLISNAIISNDFFKASLIEEPKKTMIEYSQPNTHKVLHVGHMRNLCLGNALARIYKYAGHEVITATYPGDVGTHVAKCLWYVEKEYGFPLSVPEGVEKGQWLGEIYTKATERLESEKEDEEKFNQNKTELTEILKQLHDRSGNFYNVWKTTREWSLDLMKQAYSWADVSFDRWFYESEMDEPSVKLVKEYQQKGLFVEDQGAIGVDLSEHKLGFCIVLKSDGTGMYSTKDILLAKRKFEEFKIEKNIYVVDDRQSHHFKQVFKVLELMGFDQAKDCHHLQYNVVELPDGAMSSRKGNIIPLMELIHQMEKMIKENYLKKYEGEWSDEDIEKTAKMIANGAIKYGMIRVDNIRKIVFDMDEWLKLDGDTGPYLQYVYARIASLCKKLKFNESADVDWSTLEKAQEINLLLKINSFNGIVEQSCQGLKPSSLCTYLFELGKLFNSFYAECPIGSAQSPLKETRLLLAHITGLIMKQGLDLLGIEAPERM
ncbi:MAG: arginine--tRNA ligase [Bdellovibrionales bacterium]|jgi:arginyl-tRNA synthetase|nr:arginine--tRNA ligase [Bdellovibrionales bacterium]